MRSLLIAGAVLGVAGCLPTGLPTVPPLGTSVQAGFDGQAMVFTVSPWPLDDTVAFLCLRRPGAEFTGDNPHPGPAAGCVPIEASSNADALTARFDSRAIDPAAARQFAASRPPWYLAVSGRRGPLSAASVLTVIDSPIYSPPGPS